MLNPKPLTVAGAVPALPHMTERRTGFPVHRSLGQACDTRAEGPKLLRRAQESQRSRKAPSSNGRQTHFKVRRKDLVGQLGSAA